MMDTTKGYAIKIVNPGGLRIMGIRPQCSLALMIRFQTSASHHAKLYVGLAKVNKMLNLPHTIHLHTNNLGYQATTPQRWKRCEALESVPNDGKPDMPHYPPAISSFGGDGWGTMRSAAEEISKYINNHNHMTFDMGQVIFTDTTTMTADGPFEYTLYQLSGHKWVNSDVETETSGGIIPFHYKKNNAVNATQWSIGLELALLIDDPWKMFMTTDHPKRRAFPCLPKNHCLAHEQKARMATLKRCHKKGQKKSLLPIN